MCAARQQRTARQRHYAAHRMATFRVAGGGPLLWASLSAATVNPAACGPAARERYRPAARGRTESEEIRRRSLRATEGLAAARRTLGRPAGGKARGRRDSQTARQRADSESPAVPGPRPQAIFSNKRHRAGSGLSLAPVPPPSQLTRRALVTCKGQLGCADGSRGGPDTAKRSQWRTATGSQWRKARR